MCGLNDESCWLLKLLCVFLSMVLYWSFATSCGWFPWWCGFLYYFEFVHFWISVMLCLVQMFGNESIMGHRLMNMSREVKLIYFVFLLVFSTKTCLFYFSSVYASHVGGECRCVELYIWIHRTLNIQTINPSASPLPI